MSKKERDDKINRRTQVKTALRVERAQGPQADQDRINELTRELTNLNHELAPAQARAAFA